MRIRPVHFRAFADDIRATFVAQVAANVPEYDPNYSYAVGTLVTFNSRFFRARREGFLPEPVAGRETTEWRPEAAPLEQLLPYREMSVLQAQDFASEGSLQPGTLYRLTGRGSDDVLAVALTRHHLAGAEAYTAGFDEQTRAEYLLPVRYDLGADTVQPRAGSLDTYQLLPYAATMALDFAASPAQLLKLGGSLSLVATTSRGQGQQLRLHLANVTASAVALSWPTGWAWRGIVPTALAAGKQATLSLECVWGSAESDVVAGFVAQA